MFHYHVRCCSVCQWQLHVSPPTCNCRHFDYLACILSNRCICFHRIHNSEVNIRYFLWFRFQWLRPLHLIPCWNHFALLLFCGFGVRFSDNCCLLVVVVLLRLQFSERRLDRFERLFRIPTRKLLFWRVQSNRVDGQNWSILWKNCTVHFIYVIIIIFQTSMCTGAERNQNNMIKKNWIKKKIRIYKTCTRCIKIK